MLSFPVKSTMSLALQEVYRRLFEAFGPQDWWPGRSPLEVMVGAVLVQNTSWQNVERAIANLRDADVLEAHALDAVPQEELEDLIRPAGYYRVKAKRLRALLRVLHRAIRRLDRGDGPHADDRSPRGIARRPWNRAGDGRLDPALRPGDAGLRGRCLHASRLRSARLDRLRRRLPASSEFFHDNLPSDAAMYNEFHALVVRLGKDYCRKTRPKCEACPLCELLPRGGPLEPE